MNIVICGYGGIGKALANALSEKGHMVWVATRKHFSHKAITSFQVDLTKHSAAVELLESIDKPIDLIINTIGILHEGEFQPEKNLASCQSDNIQKAIAINTLPILTLCQAIEKLQPKHHPIKVICFSARVSSISDNRLGGWHSYRMSKCALNMLIKNIAIEWSRTYKKAIICGYHPGTVATKLSEPFQKNVKPEKLFTPPQAANYCLSVMKNLTKEDSGKLLDWQGKIIAF